MGTTDMQGLFKNGDAPRLLLVVHGYPPRNFAGTENYTHAFAREMAHLGFEVGVFYPVVGATHVRKVLTCSPFENHRVYELNIVGKSLLDSIIGHGDHIVDQAFNETLHNFKPNIVHFQHTYVNLPTSIVHSAKKFGCFTCLTLHDFWLICPHVYMLRNNAFCGGPSPLSRCVDCLDETLKLNLSQNNKAKEGLLKHLEMRWQSLSSLFSSTDFVSAPSKFVLNRFAQYINLPRNIKIPLGLNYPDIESAPRKEGPLRFGYLGNITWLKNVHGLIDAFHNVVGDAQLHIYGKVSHEPELNKIISDLHKHDQRVIRHGSFIPKKLGSILQNIDVGIIPSFFENYPLVLREFLSAGIPVIASRVGGIPEIIVHGYNGLLINPKDLQELHHAMQLFVDKPELIENMKREATQVKTMRQDAIVWSNIYKHKILN